MIAVTVAPEVYHNQIAAAACQERTAAAAQWRFSGWQSSETTGAGHAEPVLRLGAPGTGWDGSTMQLGAELLLGGSQTGTVS